LKKVNKKSEKLESLRKKAETKLSKLNYQSNQFEFKELSQYIEELNIHQIELEMQNEELINAQVEIEKSRSNYADLYDFAPVGYFTFDKNGLMLNVNLTGASLLGMERNFLIKKPFVQFVEPNHQDIFFIHCRKVLKSKSSEICEIELLSKNKNKFYAKLESMLLENNVDEPNKIRTIVSDITEQKRAEEKIQNLLYEKEILFKEIHHRTKNDMYIVYGLLSNKKNDIKSLDAKKVLQESCGLIKNMAILYDKLSTASNYVDINLNDHLSSLIDDICQSNMSEKKIITVEKIIECLDVKVNVSFTLGIMINELLTNTYKHAFKGMNNGKIKISIKLKNPKTILVNISDNGVGISDDIILNKKYGMGLNLVNMISQCNSGIFEIIKNKGTMFKIEYKL